MPDFSPPEFPFPAAPSKPGVLFVDDDANLLSGLQRALRGQRERWDMAFVASGRRALELLAQRRFAIVVSDMQMPEMDGVALLSEVEKRFPETVRIILSGYAEERSIFRTLGPAHQYIAKPSEPQAIIAIMDRTLALHGILGRPSLRRLIAGLRHLPSPPELYQKLSAEMERKDSNLATIGRILGEDMAMTAQLLKITNSSYFALPSRITTATQAVRLLGLEKVRTLVLGSGLFRHYEDLDRLAPQVKRLNGYSLAVAALAERLIKADGGDPASQGKVFCAAMLCTIGMLVLLEAYPSHYPALLAATPGAGWEEGERQNFGATQGEVGAYLLGLWGFSEQVIEAMLFQSAPGQAIDANPTVLSYLHVARALGPALSLTPSRPAKAPVPLDQSYVARIGWWNKVKVWREAYAEAPAREEEGQ